MLVCTVVKVLLQVLDLLGFLVDLLVFEVNFPLETDKVELCLLVQAGQLLVLALEIFDFALEALLLLPKALLFLFDLRLQLLDPLLHFILELFVYVFDLLTKRDAGAVEHVLRLPRPTGTVVE